MVALTAQTNRNYCCHVINYSCVVQWGKYIAVWVYTNFDPENPPLIREIKDLSETAEKIVKVITYKAADKNHHLVGSYLKDDVLHKTAFSSELQFTVECEKAKEGDLLLRVLDCAVIQSQMQSGCGCSTEAVNSTNEKTEL